MTASQAKLGLIPAWSPPGPQCQIKHLTAAPVPLSRQKDIWRLKLGNWEDDGSFRRSFNNSRLNTFLSLSLSISLLHPLTISLSSCCTISVSFSPFLLLQSLISLLLCISVSLWRCTFRDLFLLVLCQKWILCTGGRFKECVVVGGCGVFRSGIAVKYLARLHSRKSQEMRSVSLSFLEFYVCGVPSWWLWMWLYVSKRPQGMGRLNVPPCHSFMLLHCMSLHICVSNSYSNVMGSRSGK